MNWQRFAKVVGSFGLLVWSTYAVACTCAYGGVFEEYSKDATVVEATIVSYGNKLSHNEALYSNMTIRIDKIITGKLKYETVILRGDPGDECLTYINSGIYKIGSKHLIAIFDTAKEQDLAGCGEVSVRVLDHIVKGVRYEDGKVIRYTKDYKTFIKELRDTSRI
jgi:hypothetical protein